MSYLYVPVVHHVMYRYTQDLVTLNWLPPSTTSLVDYRLSVVSTPYSLSHVTVDQVATTALAKGLPRLTKSAGLSPYPGLYHLIPVYPGDGKWLGVKWGNKVYVDGMLPPYYAYEAMVLLVAPRTKISAGGKGLEQKIYCKIIQIMKNMLHRFSRNTPFHNISH